MKKVLFIEDQPNIKLDVLFKWLNFKNAPIEYEIVGSITEAKRYLSNKENKVDLVVTDLGLPVFKVERVKDLLAGMELVFNMHRFNTEVPVIINSTTFVPNFNEVKKQYEERGQQLYKVDSIIDIKEWFIEFLMS